MFSTSLTKYVKKLNKPFIISCLEIERMNVGDAALGSLGEVYFSPLGLTKISNSWLLVLLSSKGLKVLKYLLLVFQPKMMINKCQKFL